MHAACRKFRLVLSNNQEDGDTPPPDILADILHTDCKCGSCLTVLYSFHVLWKSRLPSSLRWMTVHPPPAVSMLQYTYTEESENQQNERIEQIEWEECGKAGARTLIAPTGLCILSVISSLK